MQSADPQQNSPALAIVLILITGIILAGMDATAKHLALELPILMVIWGRYFFHTVITFSIYAGRTRSLGFLRARRPGLQLIRASALFGATSCMYVAITHMQLGDASAIQFLAPVLVTALSGLVLGEHVGPRRWAAVVFGFIGVLIVARPGSGVLGWWALLPLMTAAMLAVYMLMTRIIRDKDAAATTTFYSTAVGAFVLSALVPFVWQSLSPGQWGLMLLMGSAGALGHFMLVRAFFTAEASMLAPFTYSQVVASIIWGLLIFADVPSAWTICGALVVSGSGLYVWYREAALRRATS
ncbi:MAG: DMT family transporter [Rhodospirillaceae bacterium]|jgi:drug/metabolite transporter (DMT)-like permease|nr:DMT family transporter [Rhodospirillaceae bacterium]MBT5243567.1 DMT family transporter [Rhodospirillaceae bacterium]MBT5562155.1 DMT family transporter [Rhodospirillaceae bacterium]MBT6242328.1 DMT family transporter [Rhodospirillaceae bacterium]MBT7138966.1 DMT family transporter [Rhodospirillaceae bacterium]